MIRRIAFRKAIAAGALGAAAWEAAARIALALGAPLFDNTHFIGTIIAPDSPPWIWWPAGFAAHLALGVLWGLFYAQFFWALLPLPPAVQGLLFSPIPCLLAGTTVLPQLALMHPMVLSGERPPGVFAENLGLAGPLSLIAGHALFGLVLGALYVRPVGYRVGRKVALHV